MIPDNLECLHDQKWRLNNLYQIKNAHGQQVQFTLNDEQEQLYDGLHYFNVILKARQLGITTFFSILFLDLCIWNNDINAAIIADRRDNSQEIFQDKVKYAYDRLPQWVRDINPATRDNKRELRFRNGSVFRVGTTLRSGTVQFLHISEMAKICKEFPEKAKELVTGAINCVHAGMFITVESTAEGREGAYYDLCQKALAQEASGRPLTALDFKSWFFPWWTCKTYQLDPNDVYIDETMQEYFTSLEVKYNIYLNDTQKAWYVKKAEIMGDSMWQEYPSCVCGHEPIFTPKGITSLKDVEVDGEYVLAKYEKGVRDTFTVNTSLGYKVTLTDDHPILTPDRGFKQLKDLVVGDAICLGSQGSFPTDNFMLTYRPHPFIEYSIEVTDKLALFLGIFMGDGSFYKNCLSFACCAEDSDFIDKLKALIKDLLGVEPSHRITGTGKGCVELRISRGWFYEIFDLLGMVYKNSNGNIKRRIAVPDCIKRSPKKVVANFLSGLFEADGFASKSGNCIKFFSKSEEFARDIQLLLLKFGITCRNKRALKTNPMGYQYHGSEISLRLNEARKFVNEIGFQSERKRSRIIKKEESERGFKSLPISFADKIISIEESGKREVYDITTSTSQFVAGGVVVHNCPDEAFFSSNEGRLFGKQMADARQEGRIGTIHYNPNSLCYTAWDIGYKDDTSIWVFQFIGTNIHFIDFYHNDREDLTHYIKWLKNKPYLYAEHYVPHDAANKNPGTGQAYVDIARDLGISMKVLPRENNEMWGIQRVRGNLHRCYFDENKCKHGIKSLEAYRREWNDKLGCYRERPLHDWSSHACKAFCIVFQSSTVGGKCQTVEELRDIRRRNVL